jgi:hypothetical protein
MLSIDSMIYGAINSLEPPYLIRIIVTEAVPCEVREYIDLMVSELRTARDWLRAQGGDEEVSIEVVRK